MPNKKAFLLKDHEYINELYGVFIYCDGHLDFYINHHDKDLFYPLYVDTCIANKWLKMPDDMLEKFISRRVFPKERQNIWSILRDLNMTHYDIYEMFIKLHGQCVQDAMYIEETPLKSAEELIRLWKSSITAA